MHLLCIQTAAAIFYFSITFNKKRKNKNSVEKKSANSLI